MALGSMFAGLALASARLGLVHGMHTAGTLYHLPHGQRGPAAAACDEFNAGGGGEVRAAGEAAGASESDNDTVATYG